MYISISGVHGIGKSLVVRMLAKRNGWEYSPEVVDTIIHPPRFGPNSKEKLLSELWHMRQLIKREEWLVKNRHRVCITDRWWQDLIIYSKILLTPKEFRIIENIVSWIPKETPDLEIVLYAPGNSVFQGIGKRGRDREEGWGYKDIGYLHKVNNEFKAYYEAFKDLRSIELVEASPIIEETYQKVKAVIMQRMVDEKQRTLSEYRERAAVV